MPRHIGFTGTRYGMTDLQRNACFSSLRQWISMASLLPDSSLFGHHGDCVGADAEFNTLCIMEKVQVVIHPPTDSTHRAFCQGAHSILPPLSHLARNKNIVSYAELMLAAPKEMEHQDRGGTWYTIDYARKMKKPVWIIYPDGRVEKK